MGGGGSVLSTELKQSLSTASVAEFERFSKDCREKGLTPVETYKYLSKKYEELVAADQVAMKEARARKPLRGSVSAVDGIKQHGSQSREQSERRKSVSSVRSPPNEKGKESPAVSMSRRKSTTTSPAQDRNLSATKRAELADASAAAAASRAIDGKMLILPDGSSVQIAKMPSMADIEENGIAEELALEMAALATAEQFGDDDDSDDDSNDKKKSSTNAKPSNTVPAADISQIQDSYIESVVGQVFNMHKSFSLSANTSTKARPTRASIEVKPKHPLSANNNTAHSAAAHTSAHNSAPVSAGSSRVVQLLRSVLPSLDPVGIGRDPNESTMHWHEHMTTHDSHTDTYMCVVCQVPFDCKESLQFHVDNSPLHAMNTQIRKEIYESTVKEAQRLGRIAEKAIKKVAPAAAQMKNNNEKNQDCVPKSSVSGKHLLARTMSGMNLAEIEKQEDAAQELAHRNWKKAIHRVITNRIKQQYMPIVEELFATPSGVKMLYAGEKIFYKAKTYADVHIYLHIEKEILEVIVHSMPTNKQRSKMALAAAIEQEQAQFPDEDTADVSGSATTAADATASVVNHNVSTATTEVPSLATLIADKLKAQVKFVDRIYLDYAIVASLVLGVDMRESGLMLNGKDNLLLSQLKKDNANGQVSLLSGVTTNVTSITSTTTDDMEKRKIGKTFEQAIVSFLLNRLQGQSHGKQKLEVSFDLSTYANNPLLQSTALPADFVCVPLTEEQICKHYARKLEQELLSSQ